MIIYLTQLFEKEKLSANFAIEEIFDMKKNIEVDTLLTLYIIHLFEEDYACLCTTCKLDIMKEFKKQTIKKMKKKNEVSFEENVKKKLIKRYFKQHANIALIEAKYQMRVQVESKVEIEANRNL